MPSFDFGSLKTAADKAGAYNSMLSSGMSDAQIRQAATSALGAQTDADWSALQGLASAAKPSAPTAQPSGMLAAAQPLTIPQSVYQSAPQAKADYYNQQLSAGYSDAQIRQAAGPQTDADWTTLQTLAGKAPAANPATTAKPYGGLSASPVDASAVNAAWNKQLNDSSYFIQKFGDEGRRFAVETFNWELPFKQAGLDDATIKAVKGMPGLTNSINWGAVASSANPKDALLAATRQYAQQVYGGVEFRPVGNDSFGVPTYAMYGKNGEQLSLVQGDFAEAFNRANVLGGDPSQLVGVSANGTPGDSTSGFLKGMSGDTFSQWREDLKAAASGATPYSVTGNYGNLLYQQRPGSGSYDAWAASGFDPKNPIYGDPSFGGANGIDTGQGGLADPNNKSAEAIAYRKNAAVYGNVPAYQGAGSGVSGGGSGGSGAGGGIAAAAGSTGATPATGINLSQLQGASGWNVTPNQTVQGQLEQVIAADSPLMQQARMRALQQANQRGVLNSSMAVTAGNSAVLDAASAIAQQDAGTYSDAARFNADSANTFSRDNNAFVRDAFMADFNLGANEWAAQQDFARQYQMLTRQQQLQLERDAVQNGYQTARDRYMNEWSVSAADKENALRLQLANMDNPEKRLQTQIEANRKEQALTTLNNARSNYASQMITIATSGLSGEAKDKAIGDLTVSTNAIIQGTAQQLGWSPDSWLIKIDTSKPADKPAPEAATAPPVFEGGGA